ncbi:TlpA family protein disulfide reductase [Streptomyces iconiensis]|uniref:Redoxin domain-containing protein n=1 Tax=Streptomyces iconiensis TaxID=1384038 RepID=A0ABT7A9C4_9ACTN|nr:redoxin domain-containing protein [Streptomyces iconiensis]MDJ1137959.1 redoxin domain-containing protein [Streptomyces iconiensis]
MAFLVAAVVLVGLLCTLDLVLTVGLVKRLREHTALLASARPGTGYEPVGPAPGAIAVGEDVGPFSATSADGTQVSRGTVTGETLVAFFSPGCAPCKDEVPRLVRHLRASGLSRDAAWVVVVGDAGESTAFVGELGQRARVFVEQPGGELSRAFRTSAFPTVLRMAPRPGDGPDGRRCVITSDDVRLDRSAFVGA